MDIINTQTLPDGTVLVQVLAKGAVRTMLKSQYDKLVAESK